jgi:uncharacterized membrane protein
MGETIAWQDLVAPAWFLLCWIGYVWYADRRTRRATLMKRMHDYRVAWLGQMLERDNRIVDTQIVSLLVQNISFFASSAILITGGLVALLGARDRALAALAEIPVAVRSDPRVWEAKVLLLMVIFTYAFFTFTWSLRQFNYVAIMIGAAPPRELATCPGSRRFLERVAQVATRAGDYFNKAMRAFYFGLAGLAWFLDPVVFMAVTAWVVLVIWRREFRSHILAALGPVGDPIGQP